MKVKADLEETTLTGDNGRDVTGVQTTCRRCGHTTESYGTDEASVRRCLVLLREECPRGESNFYEADE
jgi:hypothetical protein